jgi:hypothetical protein
MLPKSRSSKVWKKRGCEVLGVLCTYVCNETLLFVTLYALFLCIWRKQLTQNIFYKVKKVVCDNFG